MTTGSRPAPSVVAKLLQVKAEMIHTIGDVLLMTVTPVVLTNLLLPLESSHAAIVVEKLNSVIGAENHTGDALRTGNIGRK